MKITLQCIELKYGIYNSNVSILVDDEILQNMIQYDSEIREESNECGENLYKYELVFDYKGNSYRLATDS